LALSETVAFDDAVAVAKEMTGDDTLMVVTADHSHVITIAGYPDRGHNIFGKRSGREGGRKDGGGEILHTVAMLKLSKGSLPNVRVIGVQKRG